MFFMSASSRSSMAQLPLPELFNGWVLPTPQRVLCARVSRDIWQVLVQWAGQPPSEASWEDVPNFKEHYPQFQLEDELFIEGGEMSCGE
jgi:hypothetical protein